MRWVECILEVYEAKEKATMHLIEETNSLLTENDHRSSIAEIVRLFKKRKHQEKIGGMADIKSKAENEKIEEDIHMTVQKVWHQEITPKS